MLFLVEENRHMELMTWALNKKAFLTQKNDVTFILNIVFGKIVNMIGYFIRKLSALFCPNPVTIQYIAFVDIYLSLNNWDHLECKEYS